MNTENMKLLFEEFLNSYKKIEMECITSASINNQNVQNLMDISKKMIENNIVPEKTFDFSSDKNFLESVKKYVNTF